MSPWLLIIVAGRRPVRVLWQAQDGPVLEEPFLNGNTSPYHADPAGCSHDRWRRRQAIEELVDSVIYIRECHQCGRLEIRARSGAAEEWHHIGYAHA